jgi:hypothetical protein
LSFGSGGGNRAVCNWNLKKSDETHDKWEQAFSGLSFDYKALNLSPSIL